MTETGTRAGIVGLGRWGQRLVSSLSAGGSDREGSLEFVKAVTRSPDKAARFCAEHGLPVSSDYDALLQDRDVDAVVLATPHSQHVDQIKAAAAAGKHVFVEKPLALDAEGAADAISACEEAGIVLAVGFNRRFLPAFRHLASRIESGMLGQLLHIEGGFSGPFGYSYHDGMWRGSRAENPAGGMAAMGVHVLDAMIHLMGPVAEVRALSSRNVLTADIDDTTSVTLKFRTGLTGHISTMMATAPFWRLHVFGAQAWALMRDQETLEEKSLEGEITTSSFESVDIERAELEEFANCIRTGRPYPVSSQEALNCTAAMEAIGRSAAADGAPIIV